jgi:predicted ribosomally synthesized peptide with SipW-like signal peptide
MNKKILISLGVIVAVAISAIGVSVAYFSDREVSAGNTFGAGEIDLKIDFRCNMPGCGWSLRDLDGESFFKECDVKPGDSKSGAISFHVYNNNAWGRIKLDHVHDYENVCNNPEIKAGDITCGDPGDALGELAKNLKFTIWLDQGNVAGWQCPENQPKCAADPAEGDYALNGVETASISDVSADQLVGSGWYVFPDEIQASSTYYVGVKWNLPKEVGNIAQSDSFMAWVEMEVVQSRDNPWPPQF